ncbi:nitroreductase family deazaflavin-dependent oxidoreductase [Isoptericola sp. S6320L]|uniref:nitroreductase/quinone reductase family protein n=1 Tax=Isoptericola sp. S6320L TaxID=2926411 RepID=UPI001FF5A030|nr:nitroreductase/quinone reductase family protein [Isoptericola sp. S6320L]MCK0116777.1 nitroreductase family deazaflavin-dependent oxidoreductase [Isoptericola sp. S6320L]
MSFTHPQGTYGARMPSGPLMKLANKLAAWRARRTSGSTLGMRLLVLTAVGRTSGQPRSTPLAWFPDGDGWLVVASAGGDASNPGWYRNVAAHPEEVTIELGGEKIPVTATELQGEDRAVAWERITASAKQFAGYESKTDRQIPVVRLTRR